MPILSTSRSRLDSIVYWGAFVLVSCFVTYFLNTMIDLANSENHQYDVTTAVETSQMRDHLKSERTKQAPLQVDDSADDDASD